MVVSQFTQGQLVRVDLEEELTEYEFKEGLELSEIITTYSPVLTARELLASGLVLAAAVLGSVYLYRRTRIRASQAVAISAMTAFLLLVAWVTVFSRPPWERSCELVPFWSYGAIARGVPGMLREVVLNCIMLLPVGVMLPFVFGWPLRWRRGLLFGAVCSGCIEIAQFKYTVNTMYYEVESKNNYFSL